MTANNEAKNWDEETLKRFRLLLAPVSPLTHSVTDKHAPALRFEGDPLADRVLARRTQSNGTSHVSVQVPNASIDGSPFNAFVARAVSHENC